MFAIVRIQSAGLAAISLSCGANAQGQPGETRIGEEGFLSPPASLKEMEWLVGQWVGEGIQGAPAMEPCAAYFNALTLRCAYPKRPGEGLVAAVRMQSGGELAFRFEPAD